MKKKKIVFIILALCLVPFAAIACNKGGGTIAKPAAPESRYIESFAVPKNMTCGYGSNYVLPALYAADNYGNRIAATAKVEGADGAEVELGEGGTLAVTQPVGTYYYVTYTASVENDSLSGLTMLLVCKDDDAPRLTLTDEEVIVTSGTSVNVGAYYSVSDDSGDNYTMRYDAKKDGEHMDFDGRLFIAEDGKYEIGLTAVDFSGHESEKKTLTVFSRPSYIVADFETDIDFDHNKHSGLGTRGEFKLEKSTEHVHSGEYAAKITAAKGGSVIPGNPPANNPDGLAVDTLTSSLILTKANGYTNGARLYPSYAMFGMYVWFEAYGAETLTLKYMSTTYKNNWTPSSVEYMDFYVRGVKAEGGGKCDGTGSVTLPTGEWVFIEGNVMEWSNTQISFCETDDKPFVMYIDDIQAAASAVGNVNEMSVDLGGAASKEIDLDEAIYGRVREGLSTSNFQHAVYEVENASGEEVPVSSGKVTLSAGEYKVFLVGPSGMRAGFYVTVHVTDALVSRVTFSAGGNDINALPVGKAGVAYPVPAATGEGLTITSAVTKGSEGVSVVEGKFTPAAAGEYTITYTISDGTRQETFAVTVNIVAAGEWGGDITIDEGALDGLPAAGYAGEGITVPEIRYTGGSGVVTAEVFAELTDGAGKETIPVTDGVWTPEKAGEYTLVFRVSDFFGSKEVRKQIIVSYKAEPVIYGKDNLLPVYVSGFDFTVEGVYARRYAAAGAENVPVTFAWVYKGTEHPFTGNTFRPEVDENGDRIKIKFTADGYSEESDDIPVVKPYKEDGTLAVERMFLGEGATVSADERAVKAVLDGGGDATLIYANKLPANGFSLDFEAESAGGESPITAITIILTDAADPGVKLTLKIERNAQKAGECLLIANGLRAGVMHGSFDSAPQFGIKYNNVTQEVIDGEDTVCSLANVIDGFNGFPSSEVRFEMKIESSAAATVTLRSLCGQTLRNMRSDGMAPSYRTDGELIVRYRLGETITIPRVHALDVLCPNATATITLTRPGHTTARPAYATASDGTVLNGAPSDKEYRIAGDAYGSYRLTIRLSDSAGNNRNILITLTVVDETAPTITLSGNVPTGVSRGAEVSLPSATAQDDVSGAVDVIIYVCSPYAQYEKVTDGKFRAELPGVYKVIYYARDAEGNSTRLEYEIAVNG